VAGLGGTRCDAAVVASMGGMYSTCIVFLRCLMVIGLAG